MLHLTVERDGQPPQERDFAGSTIVVGREDKLDLQLAHEDGASRQHCRLTVEGRQVFVEDLGSSNGTKVNGHRIDRRLAVKVGDIVTVGKVRLRIGAVSDGPAARRAAEPAPARAAKAIVVNQPAARKPAAAEPAPAPKKTKPAPEPEPAPGKASKPAKAAAKPAAKKAEKPEKAAPKKAGGKKK